MKMSGGFGVFERRKGLFVGVYGKRSNKKKKREKKMGNWVFLVAQYLLLLSGSIGCKRYGEVTVPVCISMYISVCLCVLLLSGRDCSLLVLLEIAYGISTY